MDKVITLPWAHQIPNDDPNRMDKLFPSFYKSVYACPLCGWFVYHPLVYCGHCRGRLERLGILDDYLEEWVSYHNNGGS